MTKVTLKTKTADDAVIVFKDAKDLFEVLVDGRDTVEELLAAAEAAADVHFAAFLAAFEDALGISGLASAYASGGVAGLTDAIEKLAGEGAFNDQLNDGLGKRSNAFSDALNAALSDMPGLSDFLDAGPEGETFDPADFAPGAGQTIGLAGAVVGGVALGLAGAWALGFTEPYEKAAKNAVSNAVNNNTFNKDVKFIPADPDAIDPADMPAVVRVFFEGFIKDQSSAADPTYGQTLTNPDDEDYGIDYGKGFDPDAQLNGLILTEKDKLEAITTADQAKQAAQFHYDSTTQPPSQDKAPAPTKPDLGGGEDFAGDSFIFVQNNNGPSGGYNQNNDLSFKTDLQAKTGTNSNGTHSPGMNMDQQDGSSVSEQVEDLLF
ncbi:MAG: hypothetical protein AAF739_07830 [Pseudomonadota bacterium]